MKRTNRSRAPARRPSTQRRPVSTGTGMGAKLLIMAAVVAAVVFGVAIFFKVGRVEVQGNTIYSSEKIMEASGLELGDNLLTVSRARVAGNVKAALPYVDQVSVGRVLPDTVVISVKESQLVFAAQTDTNTVWLISPSGKALERIDASIMEEYPQIINTAYEELHSQKKPQEKSRFLLHLYKPACLIHLMNTRFHMFPDNLLNQD